MKLSMFHISCFQPLLDEFLPRNRANGLDEIVVRDVVECASDVGIEYPLLGLVGSGQAEDLLDGVVATSAWTEPVTTPLKPGFPGWLKRIFDHCLKAAIYDDGDSEWP